MVKIVKCNNINDQTTLELSAMLANKNAALIEYLSMMSDIELPEEEAMGDVEEV